MKRVLLTLALTLITTAAFAQRPGPPPPGPGGPGGPPPGGDILAQYLSLADAQKASWEAAHKEFDAAVRPLLEQQEAAQEKVHDLLSSGSTDACAIGTAMLAVRAGGDQIKALHDALDAKLESVLTAEQKAKYEAFRAAAAFIQGHGPGPH